MAGQPLSIASAWRDEDLVLISALEHWSYCPRQCALIHLEQTYDENIFTLRGNRAHERAHREAVATEDGVRVVRGLPLWSDRLGLIGKADIVEWHGETPFPVEYKAGKKRAWGHEVVQLCAQALCLEEMLAVPVSHGAIFYHALRRRYEIEFTSQLRQQTVQIIKAIRAMLREQQLPIAPNDARCRKCSLTFTCLPSVVGEPTRMRGLQGALFRVWEEV